MTEPGTLKGKFSYMSPEQARGQEIDRRSDVFALGSVLYKSTTGLKPFGEDSDLVILARVQKAQFLVPEKARRQYPPGLAAIVRKALSAHRDDRYRTARDLGSAIEHYLMDRRVVAGPSEIAGMMHRLFEQRIAERERLLAIESAPLSDLPGDSLADETAMSPVPETAQERSTSGISVRMVVDDASEEERREAGTVLQDTGSLVVGPPVRQLPVPWIVAGAAVALVLAVFGGWAALRGGEGDEAITKETPPNDVVEDVRAAAAAPRSPVAETRRAPPPPEPTAIVTPTSIADPATPSPATPDPTEAALPDPGARPTPTPGHVRVPDRGGEHPPTKRVVSEGASGILNIRSTPWSNVIVDGRSLRATPIVGFRLAAGSHTIRLVTSDGRTATRRVNIAPNRTTLVDVRF
jgi:serine/threonine-protein kinase